MTLWDNEPKRLMKLAENAAKNVVRNVDRIKPYGRADLAGELIVFGLDLVAQRHRGLPITPDLADGLIVHHLSRVAREWVTELEKGQRASNADGEEVFGHRWTRDETTESGHEVKVGEPLPNEGREFIEKTLGNPDADAGHQRLLNRALEALCTGSGRENRAGILYKKFVRKEKLTANERTMLVTVIEELTVHLNRCLLEKPGYEFEGTGVRKFTGTDPVKYLRAEWQINDNDGSSLS